MPFTDPYTFRARIQPALASILPLGFVMFALLPDSPIFVTALFGILGTAGGTALGSHWSREPGRKKQQDLWARWGGSPATRRLRHRQTPGDEPNDPKLREQVEIWYGHSLPTQEEENADPEQAEKCYDQAVNDLIQATYDTAKFPLVFAENINYGFRRNLWGMKAFGIPVATASLIISWALFIATIWGRPWPDPLWSILANPDSTVTIRLIMAIANSGMAWIWAFYVKPSWVKPMADAYAKQLLQSAQTLNRANQQSAESKTQPDGQCN